MRSPASDALRILVVDDDSSLIRTLSDILRLHGYAPDTAATAREGLQLAESRVPALAVVDLRLPDMDGMELVSRLHALSELTEVVVLTGNASVESAIAALREHSVDYLLKPVQVEKLLQVVSVAGERWHRRQAQLALRESEEKYRMLFDRNPEAVWVYDRDTMRFLAVNEAAVRRYGYTRDEFLAMTTDQIRPRDDVDAMIDDARRGTGDRGHWRHLTKAGALLQVEITTQDITFAERPARIVLAVDVTERVTAERAAQARARQQAAVARLGQRALGADDIPSLLADASRLVAETLELPLAAVVERRNATSLMISASFGWESVVAGTPIPLTVETQAGATLLENRPIIMADLLTDRRFRTADALSAHGVRSGVSVVIPGPIAPYGVLAAHDRQVRGFTQDDVHFLQAIAHIIGVAVERAHTEAAFRQVQRLEAVGKLAGGVAHDFNNVLTAITGYAELTRMSLAPDAPQQDDMGEILAAAGRAARLTRQLLAFSRQQVLQPRLVNLGDVVSGMEGMLRRLITESIVFEIHTAADVGHVSADPGQLEQVILNLCVNARDAMPNGGRLTIEIANVELDDADARAGDGASAGEYVVLTVTDTGTGMDAETQARIFEPFFTTKPADKGTGLGLATVYGIVKQSGGVIRVATEPGRGTTFRVLLPRVRLTGEMKVPATVREEPVSTGTETLLLVEDEEALRRLARRVLSAEGYRVLVASNGEEALTVAAAHHGIIHLLVTDMIMPVIGGYRLAEELHALRPGMRVLYLSGYTDDSVSRDGFLERADGFLQKPFTGEALARKVREVLDTDPATGDT